MNAMNSDQTISLTCNEVMPRSSSKRETWTTCASAMRFPSLIASERGEIARDRVALALGHRAHEFRHVEVVGSLVSGKCAHFLDQVFIAEPGQAWRRHPVFDARLMTGLALGDALRR